MRCVCEMARSLLWNSVFVQFSKFSLCVFQLFFHVFAHSVFSSFHFTKTNHIVTADAAGQSATRTRALHSAPKGTAALAQAAATTRPATAAATATTAVSTTTVHFFHLVVDAAAAAKERHQTRQPGAHAAVAHVIRGTPICV
jgi:hypothetical protein